MDIQMKHDKQTDTKELVLTNANGKQITVTAGLFAITGDFEPVIMIGGNGSSSMAGLLATVRSGSKDFDKLIAGLYELRAHYRKLGGK